METGVVGDAIVRSKSRHINVPMPEMLDILRSRMPSTDREKFEAVSHLVEASTEFEFLDLRRRLKWSFRLFSDGALGKEFIGRTGRPLPAKALLVQKELRFVADFVMLMQTAHYELLTKELWDIALREDFELTMPIKVDLKVMDSKMLTRFWTERPGQRETLPDIANRMLIFYRGVSLGRKTDLFISEKIDLLVAYLIVDPLTTLWNRIRKITNDTAPATQKMEIEDEETREAVKRTSLKEQLPDWKSVVSRFLKKMEIKEPTFDNVVVLYRKAKATLLPSTPNNKDNYHQAKRNIVIKTFDSIPSADLELIFPEKVVNVRPISWILILVTLIVALVSAVVTVWQTDIELAVIGSALMLVFGKAFQSYTSMEREKATMMTRISKMLYDKTRDSQDGALFALLDDMADQHLKDLCLAYVLLVLSSHPQTADELQRTCEQFIDEYFGRKIQFCLEEKLPHLLTSGLIREDPTDKRLSAVDLDTAIALLTEKWNSYHKSLGSLDADASLFESPAARTMAIGAGAIGGVANIGVSAAKTLTSVITSPFKGMSQKGTLSSVFGRRSYEQSPKKDV